MDNPISLAGQIAKNTLYQLVGKFFGTIFGLITVGLMTRYLGQTGYGHYTTVISFLQFFGVLADFGLQMATTQMLSRPMANQKKIFGNILALRLISIILTLGLATLIGWLAPYPLIIKQGISLASLSFLFIALQSIFISVFQKNLAMAQVALAEIWGRIALLAGVALAVGYQWGLLGILGAVVIGNLINLVILIEQSRRYIKVAPEIDWLVWKKIWHVAWPLAITIALTLVYFRADTIIMSLTRPQNEVGIYGAVYRVLEVLIQFPYLFLGLLLPLLTKFFTLNKNLFNLILQKAFDFLVVLTIPMIFASIILGPKIMILIAGPEFAVSGELFKILIFAVAAIYLSALFGYAIVACELQKKMIKFYLTDALVSLVLYLTLIPIYSYWAAAYLTIFTEAFIAIAAFGVIKKYTDFSPNLKVAAKATLASLIMSLVLLLLLKQHLLLLIAIGLVVYFWALYLLRGFSRKTIAEITNLRSINAPKN